MKLDNEFLNDLDLKKLNLKDLTLFLKILEELENTLINNEIEVL